MDPEVATHTPGRHWAVAGDVAELSVEAVMVARGHMCCGSSSKDITDSVHALSYHQCQCWREDSSGHL